MNSRRIGRRTFMLLSGAGLAAPLAGVQFAPSGAHDRVPVIRVKTDPEKPLVSFLSWDTEGGARAERNLLRDNSSVSLRIRTAETWKQAERFPVRRNEGRYEIEIRPDAKLNLRVVQEGGQLSFNLSASGSRMGAVTGIEMQFPFNPRVTPVTLLPSARHKDGSCTLPGILSAPDFGQMLMALPAGAQVKAQLLGSRKQGTTDLLLELPLVTEARPLRLTLQPIRLDPPEGLQDQALWREIRRGWFNSWQPSARWGEQNRPFSAPAGIFANNVISDPVSFSLPFYADPALWIPKVAGISVIGLVRQTAEWWMDARTSPDGVVTGYWNYKTFLDANAGPLIAAWDYVEATADLDWLGRRITQLEHVADYYLRRDVDGDGMVEAVQSGNANTLFQPARSCNWFDAINCGYKDGYSNAMIYRAWRCLADLESRLGRKQQQARYNQAANRLRAAYAKALYNPDTGWLGWWRSKDGKLHDYATPIVNGMAIEYGLVKPELAKQILSRLWNKMRAAGFKRFDLGVPCTLIPVRREDYLLPDSLGLPKRADGSDTFQQYENGGITAGHVLHFLAAHYVAGEPERGDMLLKAMARRQASVGFQDGVQNKYPLGIDWTTWDGSPCGYEGYLADVYFFQQAVLLREPAFRRRYYRPLAGV